MVANWVAIIVILGRVFHHSLCGILDVIRPDRNVMMEEVIFVHSDHFKKSSRIENNIIKQR